MDKFSQVGNQEISAIEDLYRNYLKDPHSVDDSWRLFFKGFELARTSFDSTKGSLKSQSEDSGQAEIVTDIHAGSQPLFNRLDKEFAVINLINAYRQRGHLFTQTNPVRIRRKYSPTLAIENFGLGDDDLGVVFQAGNEIGLGPAKLNDIIAHLEKTYCRSIGVEYFYLREPQTLQWLCRKMESCNNSKVFTNANRKHIFYHLKLAVGLESFIHKKFVGQKRFSLEGAESLIPALDAVIEHGAALGIREFIVGMSHRGRLNFLANIMKKPYEVIFKEFYGAEYEEGISLGDVKYHLGYENTVETDRGNKINMILVPNPSHLEAVGSIVQGMSRSRIDHLYEGDENKLAPILIHGDAAIAGQGVVYEVIQMSQLKGYRAGGTIHLVINNQVGFTTNYLDARSSTYCTDVAKVTRSPVFHVNGDDVEALIYTVELAMEYRQQFHSDVFIDILCYRKYGHNEGDEPRFTQPLLYDAIRKHKNPRDIYADKLIENGVVKAGEPEMEIREFDDFLESKYQESEKITKLKAFRFLKDEYKRYAKPSTVDLFKKVDTGVAIDKLRALAARINHVPDDKAFFEKVHRIVADRESMIVKDSLDWAMAELLAYATLLDEGHAVRLSGQDSERGTFAHRHAAFVVEDMDKKHFPLKHLSEGQAPFHIFNSPLNEYGIMGFEYGYALARPDDLTVWEAQFGDFSNVGQVIIDQYVASAYDKWGLMNNLVLLLPHGYEGQGPEHSSARVERFLTLAAGCNMVIVMPGTPDNFFHAVRRHLKWNTRLPLVVFTPKSLLRHASVRCSLENLAHGCFREVIDDHAAEAVKVRQVVFSSGRLYYDLLKRRTEINDDTTALVRIEQLYPFPVKMTDDILKKYHYAHRVVWAQDEPANMGAWTFISDRMRHVPLEVISRPESGSPAGGLLKHHNLRLEQILSGVFASAKPKLTVQDSQLTRHPL